MRGGPRALQCDEAVTTGCRSCKGLSSPRARLRASGTDTVMAAPDHSDDAPVDDRREPTDGTADDGDRSGWSRRRRVLTTLAAVVVLPLLALLGLGTWLWVTTDVPPPGSVHPPQVSVIRYADGTELAAVGTQDRTSVPLGEVSVAARHAVLAAEDRSFYSEGGFSPKGIVRAAWVDLRGGDITQGASTITQQYARDAFLGQQRTWKRKLRELVVAVKLDRSRSKDQVLQRYLNLVYFGRGAYGIEAAAHTYFDEPASQLTASEGAVLASLLKSPSGYDPATHPEQAKARWRYVLDGMAQQGWLPGPADAQQYPQVQPRAEGDELGGPDGYLVAAVRDELGRLRFSTDDIDAGGLVVTTTLSASAQAAAVHAVQDVSGPVPPPGVYRALVSVEPGTGRIRALYGGRDYVARQLDAATTGTAQAGSSFKPYVLAAALAHGIPLSTTFDGRSPQTFAGDYEVKNFGRGRGEQFGRIDLVTALAHSVNTVFVPLGLQVGPAAVADTATALGVTTDLSRERTSPSISLGVTAVTPLDQANAYATLAAGGVRAEPFVVDRIAGPSGATLFQAHPTTRRVLAEAVATDVTYAMQQVVDAGTGRAAALPGRPVAGKTGTTSHNSAAWFVGFTPHLSTAVAVYEAQQGDSLPGFAGVSEVTGGSLPARTWQEYTADVLAGQPVVAFAAPVPIGTPGPSPSPSESPSESATPTASLASVVPSPSASSTPSATPDPAPFTTGPAASPTPQTTPPPGPVPVPLPTTSSSSQPSSSPTSSPSPSQSPTSSPSSSPSTQPPPAATSPSASASSSPAVAVAPASSAGPSSAATSSPTPVTTSSPG